MFIKAKNRYQAFAIHILISLIIFIVLSLIITYLWYPGFLFSTDGGWDGIRLIAGIDFIIGPTLTLIIYNAQKAKLKQDLFIIGLIQLSCLTFGTWTVYQERPVAVIYSEGTFYAKSQAALEIHNIDLNKVFALDTAVPAWIYVDIPENERSKLVISQLQKGPLYTFTELYSPYKDNLNKVLKGAVDPDSLPEGIDKNMSENGQIFPYSARYGDGYIEIDQNTGEFIRIH